jgi:hypothetical protein
MKIFLNPSYRAHTLFAAQAPDGAVYSLAGQHGYFGSRRPTIAAIIAIPTRKSWISITAPIDRVPHARVISGLSKSRSCLEATCFALPPPRIPCEPRGCHNRSLRRRHSCQADNFAKTI